LSVYPCGPNDIHSVQVKTIDRIIETTDVENGRTQAHDLLQKSGFDVTIWGTVSKAGGKVAPKLYWTTSVDRPGVRSDSSASRTPAHNAAPREGSYPSIDALMLRCLQRFNELAHRVLGESELASDELDRLARTHLRRMVCH
jgi:hypothetical protein